MKMFEDTSEVYAISPWIKFTHLQLGECFSIFIYIYIKKYKTPRSRDIKITTHPHLVFVSEVLFWCDIGVVQFEAEIIIEPQTTLQALIFFF